MGRIGLQTHLSAHPVETKSMRHKGFTLIEVLVAVSILATIGVASVRLVLLSQNTLSEVSSSEQLLDAAREIEVGILTGELDERGTSEDIRWETEEKETEMFGEDFGQLNFERLDFDGTERDGVTKTIRTKWREVTVRSADGRSITICLESEEDKKNDNSANQQQVEEQGDLEKTGIENQ